MICTRLSWFLWLIICNNLSLWFLTRIILFHFLLLNILEIFAASRYYFLFSFLFLLGLDCFFLFFLNWNNFLSKFFNFLLKLHFILFLCRNLLSLRIIKFIVTNMGFFREITDLLRIMKIKNCPLICMLILDCWNDWLLKLIHLIPYPEYSSASSCCCTLSSFMVDWRRGHRLSSLK